MPHHAITVADPLAYGRAAHLAILEADISPLARVIGQASADIVFAALGIRSRPLVQPNPKLERVTDGR